MKCHVTLLNEIEPYVYHRLLFEVWHIFIEVHSHTLLYASLFPEKLPEEEIIPRENWRERYYS